MKPIIVVKDLKKTYKTHKREHGIKNAFKSLFRRKYETKHALKGISFEIEQGEILGFIGPNGAGKSTTIKALVGVLFPDSGDIDVMGFVPWKDRVKYVKNIGVVFGQKPQLWWDLPAVDTFYLHKEIYNIPEKIFQKRMKYMVDMMQVADIMKTPVRDMSLGERMKCEVIAALLHNPKLVFLDEPSIGLDIIAKERLRDFILDVNKRYGTTFLITTHDMQDIEKTCKRIIIINNGVIVCDSLLSAIKDNYIKSKLIVVKSEDSLKNFRLAGCKIIERRKYDIKIELDLKKQNIKTVVNYLLGNFDIADIVIKDPPIEEIIKKIYKNE